MTEIRMIRPEDTYPLRKEVLRQGMTLSHEMPGDHGEDSFHLGLFEEGQLLCIASFMRNKHPELSGEQYQLRGMATSAQSRGRGLGRRILQEAIKELRERNIELLWCNAREVALEFYLKLGFETRGQAFEVPQVGIHYMMSLKL